jgi:hypothetical protein
MTNWAHVAGELQSGLPKPLNRRRCRLLPKILREWSRTDLQKHLSHASRAEFRARIKKLETVKKNALQLMNELDGVDEDGRTAIVAQMIIAERGGYTPGVFRGAEFDGRINRLREESEFLAKLAGIAPDKYYSQFGSRRPRNVSAYLVLKDMAEIFQWLTRKPATREVDRESYSETGPFFRFASTLWPVLFGKGTAGLPSAMKNWAEAKKQFREPSPLILNLAMRYPTWGIFEP